jgi:hypothetical protein
MLNVDLHNLKALYIYANEFMVTTISFWTSHYLVVYYMWGVYYKTLILLCIDWKIFRFLLLLEFQLFLFMFILLYVCFYLFLIMLSVDLVMHDISIKIKDFT